ncbi:hypothetical protein [Botrimarina mediterranea]|uniref:RNA polymerase sigma factor n=1 Tax=Botrimarina mediterranea TaxID=2528022 RepID=A0A518K9R9_9BACT|nr:hypothetical protein [Botrimarina mediterranea]QDV74542.1 hypothetical protein Spa11_27460 [Botrimarina mediterranea]QDV79182.1 hypothetical protein K2D_27930 [Planctomycetes bacterium K2D]
MKEPTPITDLIGKTHMGRRSAREAEDAYTDLYDYYLNRARALAAQQMGPMLKARRTPTSIAHEALTSCLENAATAPARIASRKEFEMYLCAHVNRKVANAAAHEQAQKRDIKKETPTDETPRAESSVASPVDKAVASELAIQTVRCLFEEPDEPRRAIVVLGLLLEYSPGEIREMIRPLVTEDENGELPLGYSQSSIRQILKKRKAILGKQLSKNAQADE